MKHESEPSREGSFIFGIFGINVRRASTSSDSGTKIAHPLQKSGKAFFCERHIFVKRP